MTWRWILIACLLGGFTNPLAGQAPDWVPKVRLETKPSGQTADQTLDTGTIDGRLVDTHGQREGRLRIIASWSNGHKDPPQRLVELTNHLEKNRIDMASFLPPDQEIESNKTRNAVVERLVADNDLMVDVEGLGEYRLADVLAAYGYLRLKKYNDNSNSKEHSHDR